MRKSLFSSRHEGPSDALSVRRELEERIARKETDTQKKNPFTQKETRLPSRLDLAKWLKQRGHTEACATLFDCDPWKYEPLVMMELIQRRVQHRPSEELNQLRKLIYAGSWFAHELNPQSTEIKRLMQQVRAQEQDRLEHKQRHAQRTDTEDAKEFSAILDERIAELRIIEHTAIREDAPHDEIELAVRLIEDMNVHAWLEIQGIMASHKVSQKNLLTHHLTQPLCKEIDHIRPIRDLLYRRLFTSADPSAR